MTVSNAKSFKTVLGALIKNKLRFADGTDKGKKVGMLMLFGFAYLAVMLFALLITISVGFSVVQFGMSEVGYFLILLVGAVVVLVFGIINLVTTLYLAKDTDFYSALPISPTVVFLAKLLYVYISEAVIVVAVALPAIIAFGIIVRAWAWYYIISIILLPFVPALPLMVAAIFAIPVMFIAGKTKNRNIVPFIFYCVLFFGLFTLYFYFMFSSSSMGDALTEGQLDALFSAMSVMGKILYPYTALSYAALGLPSYGLSVGLSAFVNLVIFVGVSAALFVIIILLGRCMYGQSAKSNNQTDNSKAKRSDYKSSTGLRSFIKREYTIAMRTPATAFQCFGVLLLPMAFSLILGFGFGSISIPTEDGGIVIDKFYALMLELAIIVIMLPTVANGAITSFSREGTALATLKVLPLSAKSIVKAKSIAWSILAVPASVISAIIAVCFNFDLLYFFLSIVMFSALSVAQVVFGVLWDLSKPKLKWNDPIQAVKHNAHATIGQLLGMLAGMVITGISAALPMALGLGYVGTSILFWLLSSTLLVIFVVVDLVLYKRSDKYYNVVEL